jgi:hypothetical protein
MGWFWVLWKDKVVVREPNGNESRGWRGWWPFISERGVDRLVRSVWAWWGTCKGSGWSMGSVEGVRERQERLASPGRLVAAS